MRELAPGITMSHAALPKLFPSCDPCGSAPGFVGARPGGYHSRRQGKAGSSGLLLLQMGKDSAGKGSSPSLLCSLPRC